MIVEKVCIHNDEFWFSVTRNKYRFEMLLTILTNTGGVFQIGQRFKKLPLLLPPSVCLIVVLRISVDKIIMSRPFCDSME